MRPRHEPGPARLRYPCLWYILPPLLIPLIGILGCDEQATVRSLVRYDPKEDSFRCMKVYRKIGLAREGSVDHVASIWRRRESVLISPIDTFLDGFNLFGGNSIRVFERLGPHLYRTHLLGDTRRASESKVTQVTADLDSIRVRPGSFYLDAQGQLNYYHEVALPGVEVVDVLLEEQLGRLEQEVAAAATDRPSPSERAKAGMRSWHEIREFFRRDPDPDTSGSWTGAQVTGVLAYLFMTREGPSHGGLASILAALPLNDESVRLMREVGARRSLELSRQRGTLTVSLELSETDRQQAIETFFAFREGFLRSLRRHEKLKEVPRLISQALSLRQTRGSRLELSVDFLPLFRLLATRLDPDSSGPDPEARERTISSLEARGIPISKGMSIANRIREYTDDAEALPERDGPAVEPAASTDHPKGEVELFLGEYLKAGCSGSPSGAQLPFYAPTVARFFDHGKVGREFIEGDLRTYESKWPHGTCQRL